MALPGSSALSSQKARRSTDIDDALSTQTGLPLFIAKLWNIVENPKTDSLIRWNPKGDAFVVTDPAAFSRVLLPQYFKHRNMASFIRVLNMYGFRKKPRLDGNSLRNVSEEMEFINPHFRRGYQEDLRSISRKVSARESKAVRVQETEVKQMLDELGDLRKQQDNADLRLSDLKSENESLWSELQDLRRRHQTQQTVVHKLINFLAALVRPAAGRGIFLRATGSHAALTQEANESVASPSMATALAHFQPNEDSASEGLLSLLSASGLVNMESPARQRPSSLAPEVSEDGPIVEDFVDSGNYLDVQSVQPLRRNGRKNLSNQSLSPESTATGSNGNRGGRSDSVVESKLRTNSLKSGQQTLTRSVLRADTRSGTPFSPAGAAGIWPNATQPRTNNSGGTMAVIASDRTTSRLPVHALSSLDLTQQLPSSVQSQTVNERQMPIANAELIRPNGAVVRKQKLLQQPVAPVSQAILPVDALQRAIVQYPLRLPARMVSGGKDNNSQTLLPRRAQQQQIVYRQQQSGATPLYYQPQSVNSTDNSYAGSGTPQRDEVAEANVGETSAPPASDIQGISSQLNDMQSRIESMRGSLSQQLSTPEDHDLFDKLFGIEEFSDADLQNAASDLIMGGGNADDPYYGNSFGDMFGSNGEDALNMNDGNFFGANGNTLPLTVGNTNAEGDEFDLNDVSEAFDMMQNATPSSSLRNSPSVEGNSRLVDVDAADDEFMQLLGDNGDEQVINSGRISQENTSANSASHIKSPLKTPEVRLTADMYTGNDADFMMQPRPMFPQASSSSNYMNGTSDKVADASRKAPLVGTQNSLKAASSANGNGKRKLLQTMLPSEPSLRSEFPSKKPR